MVHFTVVQQLVNFHIYHWSSPIHVLKLKNNCQEHHYIVCDVTVYTNVRFGNHYLSSFSENFSCFWLFLVVFDKFSVVFGYILVSFRYLPQALRMYWSRTTKARTKIDLICTKVVRYRNCPPLCTETVMYRKQPNPSEDIGLDCILLVL